MNKNWGKRIGTLLISGIMMLTLVACDGKKLDENADNTHVLSKEYVYVPTFTPIKVADTDTNVVNSLLKDDKLFYSLNTYHPEMERNDFKIIIADVSDLSKVETVEIQAPELEDYESNMNTFQIDADGNFYVLYDVLPSLDDGVIANTEEHTTYLVKYDSKGCKVYEQDLKDMFIDKSSSYIQSFQISNTGKLFASCNNVIYIISADGEFQKKIHTQAEWISGLIATEDERLFYTQSGNQEKGMELVEIDTDKYTIGATYKNIPEMSSLIRSGSDGKLLLKGSSYLYEYDCEVQKATPVLSWSDSSITGDYVADMVKLQDDNFLLLYKDATKGSAEIVKLTKTKAGEVPEKEIIVYAAFSPGISSVDRAIDDFNKRSSKYKIVKKTYYDDTKEWSQELQDDALTLMYADLTGNNPPDIVNLEVLSMMNLMNQGVMENLSPYLESSNVLSREEFVPSVLNAYTINDKLVTIPRVFYINTIMAKTSLVGDKPGWTLDDMIQLAENYPDADLFVYMTKKDALQTCMQYNSNAFVDYKNATCNFDTTEFIKVLEFANGFEENPDNNGNINVPEEIQQNKILLQSIRLVGLREYQMSQSMFGEPATCIGYPTSDGSQGVFMIGKEMLGITAHSMHKDGAWAFLESFWGNSSADMSSGLFFSSRKDELEDQFKVAMTPEDGDEESENATTTREQVDEIRNLIEVAKLPNDNDTEVLKIIIEEAEAYFKGQKSAEDVAKIIQSRVSLYVSENS